MSLASIFGLRLDEPRWTPQSMADMALELDRFARQLTASGEIEKAFDAQRDAYLIADESVRRSKL